MFPLTIILVALVPWLAIASPGHMASLSERLPLDDSHIAHIESTGNYLDYRDDGSIYGTLGPSELSKRDSTIPICRKLGVRRTAKILGWESIVVEATKNWGKGSRRIVTQPKNETDRGVVACHH
ncbi:hypothetical protein BD779DRAFT_1470386 [Infundibulicybe gibba]|nr:hypothetical protein BD779DRAFT_1470386 [Infundibulicybe gibba]